MERCALYDARERRANNNNNNTAFAISQTASRSGQTDRQTGTQTASRSNQTFFCYPDRPTDRQKRCVLYDARERRANNNANSIQIQSDIFCYPDRPTDKQKRCVLYDAREQRANNNANRPYPISHFFAIRTDRMLLESGILIIIQRLQSHALPDRPTDRQER